MSFICSQNALYNGFVERVFLCFPKSCALCLWRSSMHPKNSAASVERPKYLTKSLSSLWEESWGPSSEKSELDLSWGGNIVLSSESKSKRRLSKYVQTNKVNVLGHDHPSSSYRQPHPTYPLHNLTSLLFSVCIIIWIHFYKYSFKVRNWI